MIQVEHPVGGDGGETAPFLGRDGVSLRRRHPDDLTVANIVRLRGKLSVTLDCKHPTAPRSFRLVYRELLGLFSVLTLGADELLQGHALPVRQAAGYANPLPTCVDALAVVRRRLWPVPVDCSLSPLPTDALQIPRALWNRVTDTLAFAA